VDTLTSSFDLKSYVDSVLGVFVIIFAIFVVSSSSSLSSARNSRVGSACLRDSRHFPTVNNTCNRVLKRKFTDAKTCCFSVSLARRESVTKMTTRKECSAAMVGAEWFSGLSEWVSACACARSLARDCERHGGFCC
jgi:hypothetical protein